MGPVAGNNGFKLNIEFLRDEFEQVSRNTTVLLILRDPFKGRRVRVDRNPNNWMFLQPCLFLFAEY